MGLGRAFSQKEISESSVLKDITLRKGLLQLLEGVQGRLLGHL